MQIKAALKDHYKPTRTAKVKDSTQNIAKNVVWLYISNIAHRNEKFYNHFGVNVWQFLIKFNMYLHYGLEILRYFPKRNIHASSNSCV